MVDIAINWWAVLFAAIVNMVIGMAWYSPALFGKQWLKLIGKKMKDMGGNVGPAYGLTLVAALIQTFILALLVNNLGADTASDGAALGLLVWLGFAATTSISDYLFGNRPLLLWMLNQGYYLVVLMANGAILAVWH